MVARLLLPVSRHRCDRHHERAQPDRSQPASSSRAEFLKIVRKGIPDKGMQAWDKLLDNKQINQIQLYVRARTDKVLPPGRADEVGPNQGAWVPPDGWPRR